MAGKKSELRFAARDEKIFFENPEMAVKFLDEQFGSRFLLNVTLNVPVAGKADRVRRKGPSVHVHKHVAQKFIRDTFAEVDGVQFPVHLLGSDVFVG